MNKISIGRFIIASVAIAVVIVVLSEIPSALAATAPTITNINPNTGSGAGGTNITITGTGFAPTATVTIGSSSASSTVVNDTTLLVTTPAGTGAEDVIVSNGDGTFATSTGGFTYAAAAPTLSNIAITTPASKLTYHVGEALDLSGLVVTGTYNDGSTTTIPITTADISGFDSSLAAFGQYLTVATGSASTSFKVDILQTPLSLATSSNSDGSVSGTISSETTTGAVYGGVNVLLNIPAGTVITGTSSWDGTLALPYAAGAFTLTPSTGMTASAVAAVEIGAGDTPLSLSNPAKITFVGQAGKLAGWSRGSAFTPITSVCDSTSTAPTLATGTSTGAMDCKIDIGSDLVVWTTHLTTFIAYSESAASSTSPSPSPSPSPAPINVGNGAPIGLIGFPASTPSPVPTPTPTPTSAPTVGHVLGASTYNFTTRLAFGSSGEAVTALQNILTQQNMYTGPITGFFGRLTKAAVEAFQSAHGISPIGVVGPQTRAALNSLSGTSISSDNQQLIALLMQQVQALLARIASMQASSTSTTATASTTSATTTTTTATTTAATSTSMISTSTSTTSL